MNDLIASILANFYEGYNNYILYPILAFILIDFNTVSNISNTSYYFFSINLINSVSKIICTYIWNYHISNNNYNNDNLKNMFGNHSVLIYGFIINALSYILFGFSRNIYLLLLSIFLISFNVNIPVSRILLIRYYHQKKSFIIINNISRYFGALCSCIIGTYFYNYNINIHLFNHYPLLLIASISGVLGLLLSCILLLFKFKFAMLFASINEPYIISISPSNRTNINKLLYNIKYYPVIIACIMTTLTSVIFSLLYKLILLNPHINGLHIYNIYWIGLSFIIAHSIAVIINILLKILYNYTNKKIIFNICIFTILIMMLLISFVKFINTNKIIIFTIFTFIFTLFQTCISIIYNYLYYYVYEIDQNNYIIGYSTNISAALTGTLYGIIDIISLIFDAILSLIFVMLFNYLSDYRLEYSLGLLIIFSLNIILFIFVIYYSYTYKLIKN